MAAAPAAHLEHFDAAVDCIGDRGRWGGIAADELARVPFLAGKEVRLAQLGVGRSVRVGDLAHQRGVQLLDADELADVVPPVAAGADKVMAGIRSSTACRSCATIGPNVPSDRGRRNRRLAPEIFPIDRLWSHPFGEREQEAGRERRPAPNPCLTRCVHRG